MASLRSARPKKRAAFGPRFELPGRVQKQRVRVGDCRARLSHGASPATACECGMTTRAVAR